uniref:Uncharacterized protein n=1 Tax=Oryza brachyantha TaxID=4533 RepID=J3MCI9_ORYBR
MKASQDSGCSAPITAIFRRHTAIHHGIFSNGTGKPKSRSHRLRLPRCPMIDSTESWMRTFLIEAFMCHTHNAAWHTLHNILCGSAGKIDSYLDVV